MNICWPIYFSTLCIKKLYFSYALWGSLLKSMPVSPWSFSRGSHYILLETSSQCYHAIISGLCVVLRTRTLPHSRCYDRANAQWGANVFSKSLFWNRWEDLKTCFGIISKYKIVRFLRHPISAFYHLKFIMMVNIRF